MRSRLAAAGLGATQVDDDMDDPIEDSAQGSDDYVPPAKAPGAARGRVRGRAAVEEVSSSDDEGARAPKRPLARTGTVAARRR